MTLDEIKREVMHFSDKDRLRLRLFLEHLKRVDTPTIRAELSRSDHATDAGEDMTVEQLREQIAALEAEER